MNHRIMQIRDLFRMQAHWGWCHVLLGYLRKLNPKSQYFCTPIDKILNHMGHNTQQLSMQFDQHHGTETFRGLDVRVSSDADNEAVWGYAAINQDFFREIIQAIPMPLFPYTFIDIGSGKGAAVLMASEFPFRRYVGVELSEELIEIAKCNVEKFNAVKGKQFEPEWVHCDFFKWVLPAEPQVLFFNNPFPEDISLLAIKKLEQALTDRSQPSLLVFRKAPKLVGDYLNRSSCWKPLCLAPYWRIYLWQTGFSASSLQ